ncbi:hypothetical protein BU25DRAFT_433983 [Macroventuria anomochaeta]|uniref:Uncharacterized protein n=1 Tax=Macroventuria anomochaeta TaxID=301207 RepID=A0ACB6RNX6_9PLEO|nr:uncharacterized protein BU25DRAFT_433983 [Macroventuria anomochaeta]KAF2623660.1 hypothetical protein BU25DRAFT_433983 [Macroventuria anomochaeta]
MAFKVDSLGTDSLECTSLKTIYGDSKLLSQGSSAYNLAVSILVDRIDSLVLVLQGNYVLQNIDGGITVIMENFNQVSVSSDKTVDFGPSGRMASVGVPGFILEDGINLFANKIGWVCDNVASYEVVTASGVVVTAIPTLFPDLYWALRGGGSNNFKLDVFPLGKMWGGQRIYPENNFPVVLDAICSFATTKSSQDTDAAELIVSLHLYLSGTCSEYFKSPSSTYAQPVANTSVFSDWNAIQHIQNLFTFLVNTFYAELPAVQDATGFFPWISILAITAGCARPQTISSILAFFSATIKKVKAGAKSKGVSNDYIYMNYASQFEDPINSYGAANVKKLKAVSATYDPTFVFINLMPGHFKLGKGVPNPNMP